MCHYLYLVISSSLFYDVFTPHQDIRTFRYSLLDWARVWDCSPVRRQIKPYTDVEHSSRLEIVILFISFFEAWNRVATLLQISQSVGVKGKNFSALHIS